MSDVGPAKGRCVCGAVRVAAAGASRHVAACHCGTCRRWGGGPLMAVDCGTEVGFEGEEHIAVYESSAWAERGFCRRCGSHLFYRLKAERRYFVPVGLFDDLEQPVFDEEVFVEEKPSFYAFANRTEKLTGPELYARYAPPGG